MSRTAVAGCGDVPNHEHMSDFILLVVLWSSFGAIAVLEFRRRSPALLFGLSLIFAAGIPSSVYLFTDRFERAVVVEAVVFITFFNLLYFCTRLLLPGTRVVPDADDHVPTLAAVERRLLFLIGLVFILPFVLKLVEADFSLRLLAASSWRESITLSYSLMLYGAHASFGLILCLFVLRRYVLAGLALVAVAALIVVDRRRAMGIAAVAPLLLYLIFWSLQGRVRPFRIALTIGAGTMALVAFFLVQQIRYLGPLSAAAAADPELVLEAAVNRIVSVQGDLSLVDYFLWMLRNGQSVDGYGEIITVQRMLTFYLPGDLKPQEFTHSIATAIRGGEQGASIHPTVYGLSWGEAEWLGVLYAPFLAGVFRLLDRIVLRYRGKVTWAILLGPYTVFVVLTARGTVYNAWVIMLMTMIAVVGLIHLAALRRHRGLQRTIHTAPDVRPV